MRTLRLISVLSTLAASTVLQLGCAPDESSEEASAIGTLRMPLSATSTSGATYRLRNASIDLVGPQLATIATEDHLGETSVQLALATGLYDAVLAGAWTLEKEESGVFQPVSATLLSSNPQSFNILDGQNTLLEFVFQSDGDVIQIGEGTVEVVVRVEDDTTVVSENTAALCSDGVDNDGDGQVDCGDPECGTFCGPAGLLWSFVQPSPGGGVGLSGAFDGSVFFSSGPVVGQLMDGNMMWNSSPPAGMTIRDVASRPNAPEVLTAGYMGGGSPVEVTAFMPGGGILFNTFLPGPPPTSSAVRIASNNTNGAAVAYQLNSDTNLVGLDPVGNMMWQRILPGGGAPVQVSFLNAGGLPSYGILSRPAGSFRGTVVDEFGNTMLEVNRPLPPDEAPLTFGAIGGSNFGVFTGRQMAPVLTRYNYTLTGAPLGVDEFPLPGAAVAATAGEGGLVAVSDNVNQLSVLGTNGEVIAVFPAVSGHAYSRLAFVAGDIVCGTGLAGGLSYVDCFGY